MVARLALIKELASIVPQEVLVVTSIGNNSYFWAELTDREATLFHSTLGMSSSDLMRCFIRTISLTKVSRSWVRWRSSRYKGVGTCTRVADRSFCLIQVE